MTTEQNTIDIIWAAVDEAKGVPQKDRNPDFKFSELGMDSLDTFEVVMLAQDAMGIKEMVKVEDDMTLRGLAGILDKALAQQNKETCGGCDNCACG